MNLKYYTDYKLSEEIIRTPLYKLINSESTICVGNHIYPKTELVIDSPETSEDMEFLMGCYEQLNKNNSYLIKVYDPQKKNIFSKGFIIVDKSVDFYYVLNNFLDTYEKAERPVGNLFLLYMLGDIMEKAMQDDDKWDHMFRVSTHPNKGTARYTLSFGKKFKSKLDFTNFSKILEYVEENVFDLVESDNEVEE